MVPRQRQSFPLPHPSFWTKALHWAGVHFGEVMYLNPNAYSYPFGTFKKVLACGALDQFSLATGEAFKILKERIQQQPDWWFGHLGYDLKNEVESLSSQNPSRQGFADMAFFRPRHLLYVEGSELVVESTKNPEEVLKQIEETDLPPFHFDPITLQPQISREQYIETVEKLRQHIEEGDIYEINFCQEYWTSAPDLSMLSVYRALEQHSPTPFGGYYQRDGQALACASPERFLKKVGNQLVSQPIKGTAPRHTDPILDHHYKEDLLNSEKERAENLMIVDLVRNDLARSCESGTIQVEELFGLYTFPQVHQMISTVVGKLRPEIHGVDALKMAFPMGSMTGAPKVKVMELIEQYEESRRGLFSGSIGYFTPEGDYDFNVIIRSLFYDSATSALSYQVGGAITYDSNPEQEYQECMVKAQAMQKALGDSAQKASPTVK